MKIALLFRTVAWAAHKPNTHQSTEWEANIHPNTNNRKAPRALTHTQAHAHALSELKKNKTTKKTQHSRPSSEHTSRLVFTARSWLVCSLNRVCWRRQAQRLPHVSRIVRIRLYVYGDYMGPVVCCSICMPDFVYVLRQRVFYSALAIRFFCCYFWFVFVLLTT